jgi:hypothetical protein
LSPVLLGQSASHLTRLSSFPGPPLFERLDIFRSALGDLEEILGERIRTLTGHLLGESLTPEQEEQRIDQTATAIAIVKRQEEELEAESSNLVAYGDYILGQIRTAREMHRWIEGKDIFGFVEDVLGAKYPGCIFYQPEGERFLFEVSLPEDARHDLERFTRERRLSTSTKLGGLTSSPVKCLFENKIASTPEGGIEVINQLHPLTRFACHVADSLQAGHHAAVSLKIEKRRLPMPLQSEVYVFLIQKWTFNGLQQTERLYYALVPAGGAEDVLSQQDAERLISFAVKYGMDWREAASDVDTGMMARIGFEKCLASADDSYERHVADLGDQNQDRVDIHVKNLENHLRMQVAKLTAIRDLHRMRDREPLAKATEGKMEKLEERVRRKKVELEERRSVETSKEDICAGVILLV